MKNEKQVVHDAISFYKGFLEAVRWCQSEYGINLEHRIEDAESLIEQYKFRLKLLKEEEEDARYYKRNNSKRNGAKRKNSIY